MCGVCILFHISVLLGRSLLVNPILSHPLPADYLCTVGSSYRHEFFFYSFFSFFSSSLTLLYDMSLSAPARGLAIGILKRFPLLQELGIGMLLAAPKKKTSHMKKRQRLLANNAHRNNSKYMNNLNRCPSCGNYKRMNTLCAFCVGEIQHLWKSHLRDLDAKEQKGNILDELSDLDKRVLYPGKKDTAYIEKLKDKGSYLKRKTRTLPVERQ